ncbi:MAG: AAA family ATPase [Kiritimatiellae bacterium]|nr:AAA family ATPase [Kiritimatiellia bacterium]
MDRIAENRLLEWKNRKERKPLVLMGARQVGKTWLMQDFGKRNFGHVHIFNFDSQKDLAGFFDSTQEPNEILPKLAALSGRRIDVANDLVIFDEVQECPDALNSLKYFCEKC